MWRCSPRMGDHCQLIRSTSEDPKSDSWLCHRCSRMPLCSKESKLKPGKESPSKCETSTKKREMPSLMQSKTRSCHCGQEKLLHDILGTIDCNISYHYHYGNRNKFCRRFRTSTYSIFKGMGLAGGSTIWGGNGKFGNGKLPPGFGLGFSGETAGGGGILGGSCRIAAST